MSSTNSNDKQHTAGSKPSANSGRGPSSFVASSRMSVANINSSLASKPTISSSSSPSTSNAKLSIAKSGSHTLHQTSASLSYPSPNNRFQQHLQIVNAPTSLANLAQFSGISLMPVGSMEGPTSNIGTAKNNTSITQQNSFNQRNRNISPTANIESNFMAGSSNNGRCNTTEDNIAAAKRKHSEQANQAPSSISRQVPSQATKCPRQPQSIFNLAATIPSIQMLNARQVGANPQASSETNRRSISNGLLKNQHNQSTNSQPKARAASSKKTCQSLSSNHANDMDRLASGMSSNLPLFSDVPDFRSNSQANPIGNINSESSAPARENSDLQSFIEQSSSDDMNNISLLRLMAILNNPALTITPVISAPAHSKQAENSTSFRGTERFSSSDDRGSPALGTAFDQDIRNKAKTRVPKSAANLQIIYKGNKSKAFDVLNDDSKPKAIEDVGSLNNLQATCRPWNSLITGDSSNHSATLTWVNASNPNLATKHDIESYSIDNNVGDSSELIPASVRNLMQKSSTNEPQTLSVNMLKQLASQSGDCGWNSEQDKSMIESDCIVRQPNRIKDLGGGVMFEKRLELVTRSSIPPKLAKKPLKGTIGKLYIPRESETKNSKPTAEKDPGVFLDEVKVDSLECGMVHLSDQHFILDSLMPEASERKPDNSLPEPDDIFVNRSKRIMSKIDTMLERKKRRRFERISSRSSPKTTSLEDQCADSEAEWSSDEIMDLDSLCVSKIQPPLEEVETQEKKDHLMSVGLISRSERNKLLTKQTETKSNIYSPIALQDPETSIRAPEDIQQFVSAILKTGGTNVQLRIDTNIKRNDLPLIEGLNRNTSRIKMTYMNVLGLEKRSKRTTLYKAKVSENSNQQIARANDLNGKSISTLTNMNRDGDVLLNAQSNIKQQNGNRQLIVPRVSHLAPKSCRDAIVSVPNKDEYMKSLGLMAS